MKIILLKDVRHVGKKYETKSVADGFAMNSLIPGKMAVVATPSALKQLETMKAQDEAGRKGREEAMAKNLAAVEGVTITKKGKANEQGHLFASIHKEDIVDELRKQSGLEIESDHILLDKPIKEAGEHKIPVEVAGKKAEFILIVEAE